MDDDFYFFNEFEDALDPTDDDDQYNYKSKKGSKICLDNI